MKYTFINTHWQKLHSSCDVIKIYFLICQYQLYIYLILNFITIISSFILRFDLKGNKESRLSSYLLRRAESSFCDTLQTFFLFFPPDPTTAYFWFCFNWLFDLQFSVMTFLTIAPIKQIPIYADIYLDETNYPAILAHHYLWKAVTN